MESCYQFSLLRRLCPRFLSLSRLFQNGDDPDKALEYISFSTFSNEVSIPTLKQGGQLQSEEWIEQIQREGVLNSIRQRESTIEGWVLTPENLLSNSATSVLLAFYMAIAVMVSFVGRKICAVQIRLCVLKIFSNFFPSFPSSLHSLHISVALPPTRRVSLSPHFQQSEGGGPPN